MQCSAVPFSSFPVSHLYSGVSGFQFDFCFQFNFRFFFKRSPLCGLFQGARARRVQGGTGPTLNETKFFFFSFCVPRVLPRSIFWGVCMVVVVFRERR